MYAFGMLGSYFSQGVYAVAGPFQGAVDIIVVQQQDGTFKSSPWYVKCGDFQGVLKRREKIVEISVNGIKADFYMLLNSRGEAYFEKDVEDAMLALPSTSSSEGGDISESETSSTSDMPKLQETGINKPEGLSNTKVQAMVKPSQVMDMASPTLVGSSQGNGTKNLRSPPELSFQAGLSEHRKSPSTVPGNTASGNTSEQGEANMPAQLTSSLGQADNQVEQGEANLPAPVTSSSDKLSELDLIELDSEPSKRYATYNVDSLQLTDIDASEPEEAPGLDVNPMMISVHGANLILAKPESSILSQFIDNDRCASNQNATAGTVPEEVAETAGPVIESADMDVSGSDDMVPCNLQTVITEDWFGLERRTGLESGDEHLSTEAKPERSDTKVLDELIWDDYKIVTAEEERDLHNALNKASVLGVHVDDERWKVDTESKKDTELVDSAVWVSDALASDATNPVAITIAGDNTLVQDGGGDGSMKEDGKDVLCKVEEGPPVEVNKAVEIPTIPMVPPPSRWSMWPLSFRRSRPGTAPSMDPQVQKQALLAATKIAVGSPLTEEILRKNGYYEWPQKPKLRSYVPTSEQIKSLKLKEGQNKVTFTFPRVLGRTQVDANIFLWKWNTRIVISDVDGTITKSDVLGQVMPLVGRDWSQSGVARLFSAVKENGYEVLFLSARAISQAYLTRQFLVNLKQDGENLPEGPVFISPDGLIPSLYREVVRRAPHEFKISCLEGIKQLFPCDVNPFYAGFGNRVTDEISYAKVGIPKGKIFTINPKGEVMVNHHVHVKSYTSIHALVDDMFPPVYSSEQEDFNSWNFWKLPLPEIEQELSAPKSSKSQKGGNLKK